MSKSLLPALEPSFHSAKTDPVIHADAERRLDEMMAANPWMDPSEIDLVTERILSENASFRSKANKLLALADKLNEAMSSYITCRRGCTNCCSMITHVYEFEAERLAAASGRKMTRIPARSHNEVLTAGLQYAGKPCPFLLDGSCSVYEVRPIICRLHHSFNDDADQCSTDIPLDKKAGVVQYNPDILEIPYHNLVREYRRTEPWGCIHEFFPD